LEYFKKIYKKIVFLRKTYILHFPKKEFYKIGLYGYLGYFERYKNVLQQLGTLKWNPWAKKEEQSSSQTHEIRSLVAKYQGRILPRPNSFSLVFWGSLLASCLIVFGQMIGIVGGFTFTLMFLLLWVVWLYIRRTLSERKILEVARRSDETRIWLTNYLQGIQSKLECPRANPEKTQSDSRTLLHWGHRDCSTSQIKPFEDISSLSSVIYANERDFL
jgi:hypothetical protein